MAEEKEFIWHCFWAAFTQEALKIVREYEKDLSRCNKASLVGTWVSYKSASCSTLSRTFSTVKEAKKNSLEQELEAVSSRIYCITN